MYWDQGQILEARYQRWRHDRWVRMYAQPLPELLHAGDFRKGRLATLTARGELIRVAAHDYAKPPPREWPRWRRRWYVARASARAVALSVPDTCAVGGVHAALLHGLPALWIPPAVEVHTEVRHTAGEARIGHRRVVRAGVSADVEVIDGMRVTSLERTVIECARRLPLNQGLVVADAALNKTAWPDPKQRAAGDRAIAQVRARMVAILAREPRRVGNPRARQVLQIADGWSESPLESRMRRKMLAIGLPAPRLQTEILTRRHQYFVDATLDWERPDGGIWRAVFEADGRGKQERAANVNRDREREAEIRMTGAEYLSVTTELLDRYGFADFAERAAAIVPPEARASMRIDERYLTDAERRAHFTLDLPTR